MSMHSYAFICHLFQNDFLLIFINMLLVHYSILKMKRFQCKYYGCTLNAEIVPRINCRTHYLSRAFFMKIATFHARDIFISPFATFNAHDYRIFQFFKCLVLSNFLTVGKYLFCRGNPPCNTVKCQINGGPSKQGIGKNSEM